MKYIEIEIPSHTVSASDSIDTKRIYSSQALLSHQLFSDGATQYQWLPIILMVVGYSLKLNRTHDYRVVREVDRVDHTNRLEHPDGSRAHSQIVKRSRSQVFSPIRFGRASA